MSEQSHGTRRRMLRVLMPRARHIPPEQMMTNRIRQNPVHRKQFVQQSEQASTIRLEHLPGRRRAQLKWHRSLEGKPPRHLKSIRIHLRLRPSVFLSVDGPRHSDRCHVRGCYVRLAGRGSASWNRVRGSAIQHRVHWNLVAHASEHLARLGARIGHARSPVGGLGRKQVLCLLPLLLVALRPRPLWHAQ